MQTTIMIISILALIFGGLIIIARNKIKNIPAIADHEKIVTLTDKNFQFKTKNKVILIDFWASWCAPCKMMAPVLNDVASELTGNSHVGKVNIELYQSLAQRFKIRNILTMILLKNGREINRFVGIKNKEFLLQQINKI